MSSDGLWENRLGKQRDGGVFDLCHDVHQLRPDPFNPERYELSPDRNLLNPERDLACLGGSVTVVPVGPFSSWP